MDHTETIGLNPSVEAPIGVARRGANKTSKPTAVEPATAASDRSSRTGKPASKRAAAKLVVARGVGGDEAKKPAMKRTDPKPGAKNPNKSKKEQLTGLLSKPGGVRVSVLVERLGWQAHTVRAALSGLRKQGFSIAVSKSAKTGETIYAITSAPDAAATKEASA